MFDLICSAANCEKPVVIEMCSRTRAEASPETACENLSVPWRSRWKQQRCISRCSRVHCLLPHMGLFSLCLCPCVSRQDILNYFAQLPPWTLATARQYTHHADTRTYSHGDHSSCPSHTWILLDTQQTSRNNNKKRKKVLLWFCWTGQKFRYCFCL